MKTSEIPDYSKFKIGIIGMGPVGSILAMHFQDAGCEVIICDKDKIKMNVFRKEGVFFEGIIDKHITFKNIITDVKEFSKYEPDILFLL